MKPPPLPQTPTLVSLSLILYFYFISLFLSFSVIPSSSIAACLSVSSVCVRCTWSLSVDGVSDLMWPERSARAAFLHFKRIRLANDELGWV
uniref:Uncharacterized protein n=1 Tax=Pygocentrus nattereri TaxID=42514 RepID=A0A3B4C3I8_PYGNA